MGLFWLCVGIFVVSMIALAILPKKRNIIYTCCLIPLVSFLVILTVALSWQQAVIDDGESVFSLEINDTITTIYYDPSEDAYFYVKAEKNLFKPQYFRVYANTEKAAEFKEHYDALQTINMFE